ncbi:VHS domain-containing protein [Carex littledalei]|uniref:VHS domain-containing protein n=1 Tax=Carex littledalei TaxID=544730 RepID=A0A833V8I9_9POAL|nr:VHS domain-containing protein [Carex littledalei]
MDTSRRAVESYWRSRLVDGVSTDEDKVAPVYKLEEICELLRVSDSSIVKEISDFVLKRLDHKSPMVKQKALRLIKYAVGKSGNEFRREMQRHSTAVRQLVHYKGHPDPLRGDALNKAVREMANEAMAAIFSTEESKPGPVVSSEGLGKRIQGFGNTNYDPSAREDKKSFLSEVVEIGSASIKQGLTTFATAHNIMKPENNSSGGSGTYRSPATLRRSLTTEKNSDGYTEANWSGASSSVSKTVQTTKWGPDSGAGLSTSGTNDDAGLGSGRTGMKTREERLLETIVTTGGVRLQPTRDALQVFLAEATKLDAVVMSRAIDTKLQSPLWQVRMKAICVLEAILRKKDDEPYSIISSYFSENSDSVVRCCDLPQVSLREKATKVLNMLDGEQSTETRSVPEPEVETKPSPAVQLPDLIDTGDLLDDQIPMEMLTQNNTGNNHNTSQTIDDLFGSVGPTIPDISTSGVTDVSTVNIADMSNTPTGNSTDPFADVSFHVNEDKEPKNDLFSGLTVDEKSSSVSKNELPDIFGDISLKTADQNNIFGDISPKTDQNNVNDLMAGLNISDSISQGQTSQPLTGGAVNGALGLNSLYSQAPPSQFNNVPQQFMLNPAFLGQQMNINYGAMGAFIAQQQQILQNLGGYNPGLGANINISNNNMGFGGMDGGFGTTGCLGSPLPDIFQGTNNPAQSHVAMMGSSKKEETKAFDFVSDHLSAARGSKKLL